MDTNSSADTPRDDSNVINISDNAQIKIDGDLVAGDKNVFISGSTDEDVASGLADKSHALRMSQPVLALLLAVEAARRADTLRVWCNLLDALLAVTDPRILLQERDPERIAISADRKKRASVNEDGTILLWDLTKDQKLGQLEGGHKDDRHKDFVSCLAFSPNGRKLASGGYDGKICLWDLERLKLYSAQPREHECFVSSLAFSPDGKILASGSSDQLVRLWDVSNRRAYSKPLQRHTASVSNVAFSTGGKILASTTNYDPPNPEETVLWDMRLPQPIGLRLDTYIPDVRRMDMELGSWKNQACKIAKRNLTRVEWGKYVSNGIKTWEDYQKNPTCPNLPVES